MIEHPKGMVRNYRLKNEQAKLSRAFENLANKRPRRLISLLEQGLESNRQALRLIRKNSLTELEPAIDFLIRLAMLCTIIPFKAGEVVAAKGGQSKAAQLVSRLREVSYYDRVIENVVLPLAFRRARAIGAKKIGDVNQLTFKEIIKGNPVDIKARRAAIRAGETFVYRNLKGKEKISWTSAAPKLIEELEGKSFNSGAIKGTIACRGKARGRARLVLTNDIRKIRFNRGDVLVAISTSPELMPLIRKCSAIITDEGGLTCHAAIISREMKLPCIIGTKNSTQALKSGDLVEVDAEQGVVRKI